MDVKNWVTYQDLARPQQIMNTVTCELVLLSESASVQLFPMFYFRASLHIHLSKAWKFLFMQTVITPCTHSASTFQKSLHKCIVHKILVYFKSNQWNNEQYFMDISLLLSFMFSFYIVISQVLVWGSSPPSYKSCVVGGIPSQTYGNTWWCSCLLLPT